MTPDISEYLSEAIHRVSTLRRLAPTRVREFFPEAESAAFLHNIIGLDVAPIRTAGRTAKLSARTPRGIFIDLRLPEAGS